MIAEFKVSNYRAFNEASPLQLRLEDGLIALVGPNNSGKSSVLKFFYEFRALWGLFSRPNGNLIAALTGVNIQGIGNFTGTNDQAEVFNNQNKRPILIDIGIPTLAKVPNTLRVQIQFFNSTANFSWRLAIDDRDDPVHIRTDVQFRGTTLEFSTARTSFDPLFALMSLLSNAKYIGPFRNAINIGAQTNYFDISVGTDFINTWERWKVGPKKSENNVIQRVSRDIQRIFGFKSLEILSSKELHTLQIYADGQSYKLNELGGGIAQFLLVLGNVAILNPTLLLLDEPELNLHPSMQMDFLSTLGSYTKHGVLYATHSLGLARSTAAKIYSVVQREGVSSINPWEGTPQLPELLGELQYSCYKEIGYDKVLLVEGVEDILSVQQLLRLYNLEHQIILLPLGGGAMINGSRAAELSQVTRISKNVFSLIDSEKASADEPLKMARQEFAEICKALKIKLHILERRALENYLSDTAIKEFKGAAFSALGPFDLPGLHGSALSKRENWRIANLMRREDIENTDLGSFIKSLAS